jgi:hypothetical protein
MSQHPYTGNTFLSSTVLMTVHIIKYTYSATSTAIIIIFIIFVYELTSIDPL